jgi:hypothetical protein
MKIVEATYREAHIIYQAIDICGSSFVDISLGTRSREHNIYTSWQAIMSDDHTAVRLVSLHLRNS